MTLEVPDGDSSTAVQTAAQQVATLLTTLRPPATVTTQFASHPHQHAVAGPSAPPATTAPNHVPPHLRSPVCHLRSPSPTTSATYTLLPPNVQTNSMPEGIIPHNPSLHPLPYMAQYPTASAKLNSASLPSSSRPAGLCPLPQPMQSPITTSLQPAATQPFRLGPVPTPSPGHPPAPCAAAPQFSQALAAAPQPHSQVPAAGTSNIHQIGTIQGVNGVDLAHQQSIMQAAPAPHHGAPVQQQHHQYGPTHSSRSLDTAADLIETSLHQCTAPQGHQERTTTVHQVPFYSTTQNHQTTAAPFMSHANNPSSTAQIPGTSDADAQTHPESACLGPRMQHQRLADTRCFTRMQMPQCAADPLYHRRRARSWSPTRCRHPFVALDAPLHAHQQGGVPTGRAKSLQPHRSSSSLQTTPLCPPGELYTDPFAASVPYTSPPLQHPHPPGDTRFNPRNRQVQHSQPCRPQQELAPAWESIHQGQSVSAREGSQPAHMHSPGCQALSMMIDRLQSLRADAKASEPVAHHRVLPPRELIARLSEPLEIAPMSDSEDHGRPCSRQCWRPPRPPHIKVQSTRHTPMGHSRSASPSIMRSNLQGINPSLQYTPTLSSTCSSQLNHPHLVQPSGKRREPYPAHSPPMPKSSSAPECMSPPRSTQPSGSAGKLRSNLTHPLNCKSRCKSAHRIEKRSPKQTIPGRRAASLCPASKRLVALRSSLDQKLGQRDPERSRSLKGSSYSPCKGRPGGTGNPLLADHIPAQEPSMTSLQTMLDSSAPGSATAKHPRGESGGASHRTPRKGSWESEKPLKGQPTPAYARAVNSHERVEDASRQVGVSSRSNSCNSARGQSNSVNNSPRSSSISLPDNQMKSPRSEYLLDFVESQHDSDPTEGNLLSNGRHAVNLHSSTVGSHTSLLCTEVLSLKAVLES